VFGGGIPHLHVHLAPHRTGDSLNSAIIKGEFDSRKLPSGATEMISRDYPPLPEEELLACADRATALLR
jgi:diadenosine tetraphosphate (Ap4A) HIT family hydrolase